MASIAGAFMATGLLKLRGVHGHAGWRYLFLVEGGLTLLIGLGSFFMMPPGPTQTKAWYRPKGWFNEREEVIIVNRSVRSAPLTLQVLMPGLAAYLDSKPAPPESLTHPEEMRLHLPSSFPVSVRETICIVGLPAEEERLRHAQAHDALRDLRRHLRTRMLAHQFRRKHTSGQAAYTKSQALQSSIEVSIAI